MNHILAEIDMSIDRLTQARNLLAGTSFNGHDINQPKRGPGRPPNSSKVPTVVALSSLAQSKKNGIWQSNEFKEKMRRITKENWKKRRAAEKKAAKAA